MKMSAFVIGGACCLVAATAHADVPMNGTFTVTHACAAYQSIRKGTNPGAVTIVPNSTYRVIAKNKPDATHYRIRIEGAEPADRWVSVACGTVSDGATAAPAPDTQSSPLPGPRAERPQAAPGDTSSSGSSGARATHVLALSWEPAFCAKHQDKGECRTLKAGDFASTHLSLHGLWPQPRGTQYCNVPAAVQQFDRDHNWDALPEPDMTPATLKKLAGVMPGVNSRLQRHEWIVHGTCYGTNADNYFARAAGLAEAVNGSKVSQLFAGAAGRSLSANDIRGAFDEAFGPGVGARVQVSCSGRGENRKITELTLSLAGDVPGSTMGLADLMRAAQPIAPGCPGGYVTPAPR